MLIGSFMVPKETPSSSVGYAEEEEEEEALGTTVRFKRLRSKEEGRVLLL